MYNLFIALGSAASKLTEADIRVCVGSTDCPTVTMSFSDVPVIACVTTPHGVTPLAERGASDGETSLLIDGYVIAGDSRSGNDSRTLSLLIDDIHSNSVSHALDSLSAGAFNLVYIDTKFRSVSVANDEVGAIPLYYAYTTGGMILSTSAVAIARTNLLSGGLDLTACAATLRYGYAIGDRFFMNDIRVLRSGTIVHWSENGAHIKKYATCLSERVTGQEGIDIENVAETVRASVARAALVDKNVAQLQSAGLDSRLLLAAWPDGYDPPCYSYGSQESTEHRIARQIADRRGSTFTHIRPNGDAIAETIDRLFELNGMIAYADRHRISEKIKNDGYTTILDGFQGGVLLGGAYYYHDRSPSLIDMLFRFATVYKEKSVSKIGIPSIASAIQKHIAGQLSIRQKFPFLNDEFANELEKQPTIGDIETECRRVCPVNDSVGTLFRNFFLDNRGLHAIAHQGVMCRDFVQPLFPYSNDKALYDLCLGLNPKKAAYRRVYYKMYAKYFPDYADIVYGDSMAPAKWPPLGHGVYKFAAKLERRLTGSRTSLFRSSISPNNWASWLRESETLRNILVRDLEGAGIVDSKKLQRYVEELASGTRSGKGDLFHLASIARWAKLA